MNRRVRKRYQAQYLGRSCFEVSSIFTGLWFSLQPAINHRLRHHHHHCELSSFCLSVEVAVVLRPPPYHLHR